MVGERQESVVDIPILSVLRLQRNLQLLAYHPAAIQSQCPVSLLTSSEQPRLPHNNIRLQSASHEVRNSKQKQTAVRHHLTRF